LYFISQYDEATSFSFIWISMQHQNELFSSVKAISRSLNFPACHKRPEVDFQVAVRDLPNNIKRALICSRLRREQRQNFAQGARGAVYHFPVALRTQCRRLENQQRASFLSFRRGTGCSRDFRRGVAARNFRLALGEGGRGDKSVWPFDIGRFYTRRLIYTRRFYSHLYVHTRK
jgi:hypothetical protein